MNFNIIDIFGWVGAVINILFSFLQLLQYRKLCKGQINYTQTPNIESLTNYLNSIIWLIYGFKIQDLPLQTCFAFVASFSLICTLTYLIYYGRVNSCRSLLYSINLAIITFLIGFIFLLFIKKSDIIGFIGILSSICLCVSPSKIIINVIKTRNYKIIPMYLVLINLIGNTSWIIYGFMKVDFYIIIPNFLSMIFAFILLFIWKIYKKKKVIRNKYDINRSYAPNVTNNKSLQTRSVSIE